MDTDEIEAIRERRALVDDWPDVSGGEGFGGLGYLRVEEALYRDTVELGDDSFWMGRTRPSALFIANAPTDIDTLLAEVSRLSAEVEQVGRAIDFIQTEDGYDNGMELLCKIAGRPNRWPKDAKTVSIEEVAQDL